MFVFRNKRSKRHGALSNEGYACSQESSCLKKGKSYTWCLNKSKCQSFCLRKSKILVQILWALLNFKVDKRFLLKIKQFTDALLNFNRIEECDGRLAYVESSRPGKKDVNINGQIHSNLNNILSKNEILRAIKQVFRTSQLCMRESVHDRPKSWYGVLQLIRQVRRSG